MEAGIFRREAGNDRQRRTHRLERRGRTERLDSDATASAVPSDVRQLRCRDRAHQHHLRIRSGAKCRRSAAAGAKKAHRHGKKLSSYRKKGHDPQQRDAQHRSRPRNLRSAPRRNIDYLRTRPRPTLSPALFPVLIPSSPPGLVTAVPARTSERRRPKIPRLLARAKPIFTARNYSTRQCTHSIALTFWHTARILGLSAPPMPIRLTLGDVPLTGKQLQISDLGGPDVVLGGIGGAARAPKFKRGFTRRRGRGDCGSYSPRRS